LIRLLLDQGLPTSAVLSLRDAGWDAVHAVELELSRANDAFILDYARTDRRVICTLDADFHALLATSGYCDPSVIRIRQEGLGGAQLAALLMKIWPRIADAVAKGAMVTVTGQAIRIRGLPVSP
jgi:predicted nuclease of predicted toxin-antitoxin system